jgi:hypothetical protein
LLPCPVRVFGTHEWQAAVDWLGFPIAPHLSFRLIRESGVLVVRPTGPLGPEHFDAVAMTVDPWIESHGALEGLVVHAREFPGWEDLGAFIRHVQFVREHHLQVHRVALVADSRLAHLMPKLGEHVITAEVKHFRYDELNLAISWAAKGQVQDEDGVESSSRPDMPPRRPREIEHGAADHPRSSASAIRKMPKGVSSPGRNGRSP